MCFEAGSGVSKSLETEDESVDGFGRSAGKIL